MLRKQITRRGFLKGLATTSAGAVLLAACAAPAPAGGGGQAAETTGAETAPAATDVTLRIQIAAGSLSIMPTHFAEVFTADTGVNVELEETIYGEIETKTQTGFISNTLQDIVYGHHRWIFINYLKGIYMELDDMFAADAPPDFADIYPSVLEGNKFEGKSFNLPETVHPGGNIAINFNKSYLESKGLPLPQAGWTMSDWTELARAATDTEAGIFGLGFDSMLALHYYSNVSRSFGAVDSTDSWLMDQEGRNMTFNTPLHAEIADWYVGLLNDGVSPRDADRQGAEPSLFVAGLEATHASTVGVLTNNQAQVGDRFEVDAVPLPVGAEGRQGTCYSGNHYMINSKTAHPEEAYDFLKLITSTEAGIYMVLESKGQPNGHKSAWTDPKVNEINRMFGVTDALITQGIEPYPMPWNTRFTEANNTFQAELNLIWEGEQTFAEYASEVERKTQAILDDGRPA